MKTINEVIKLAQLLDKSSVKSLILIGFFSIFLDIGGLMIFANVIKCFIGGGECLLIQTHLHLTKIMILLLVIFILSLRFILNIIVTDRQIFFSMELEKSLRRRLIESYVYAQDKISRNKISELVSDSFVSSSAIAINLFAPAIKLISDIFVFLILFIVASIYDFEASVFSLVLILMLTAILYYYDKYATNSRDPGRLDLAQKNVFEEVSEIIECREIFAIDRSILNDKFNSSYELLYRDIKSNAIASGRKPKIVLELMLMISLLLILFQDWSSQLKNPTLFFPILIGMSLKFFPSLAGYLSFISSLRFFKETLENVKRKINSNKLKYATYRMPIKEIELRNVSYSIDGLAIINQVNLRFTTGKLYVITGSSGAGKSSLLELILGFLVPENGNILVNSHIVRGILSGGVSYLKQRVPILNQSFADNIGHNQNAIWEKFVFKKLKLNKIEANAAGKDLRSINLSIGQEQRVGLARSLLSDASLIVMDEPTSALDSTVAMNVYELLKIKSEKAIVIVVTHDSRIISFADEVINLEQGCVKS